MANNPDTKLQANFKMANGDLINVYAVDQLDFELQLAAIQDTAELIKSVSNTLMGRTAANVEVDAWTIKQAVGVVQEVLGAEAQPTCKHGYREYKTGTSKTGNAYKCWSCPSKDRKDQCAVQWIN